MSVRAKMQCKEIKETQWGNTGTAKDIRLEPMYSADPLSENAQFYRATPTGVIELKCLNPVASEQFKVGEFYYIDFTPVPVPTAPTI